MERLTMGKSNIEIDDDSSMFTFDAGNVVTESGVSVTAPPSSLAQFIALPVVIDFNREDEHTVEYLFHVDQIIHFGGPDPSQDAKEGYFVLETTMDEHLIKGDWETFKSKLNTMATLWD
jgi:hypothetical protein